MSAMKKETLTLTERKLIEMLGENTGAHMLDSGGAYGRHWERNQGRGWIDEPEVKTVFGIDNEGKLEVEATLNVFHFLNARLDYSPMMQSRWTRFCNKPENKHDSKYSLMEPFAKHVGVNRSYMVNTYNSEDALSQVLQYCQFETESGDWYVLLQIHGGCDVRGGYTDPVAFRICGDNEYCLSANAKISLNEEGGKRHYWDSENAGYSFEPGESSGEPGLFGPVYSKAWDLEKTPATDDSSLLGDGIHFVVIDKRAYSPDGYEITANGWPA